MVDASSIRPHMPVVGSDGKHVGTVDHVDGSRIKLARKDAADGEHHYVALSAVGRVDSIVHLTIAAAAALVGTAAGAATSAGIGDAEGPLPPVKNRAVDGAKPRGNFYLPWIVGLIGLILLFLLFRGCARHEETATAPVAAPAGSQVVGPALPVEAITLPDGTKVNVTPNTLNYELQRYLASNEPAPRSFTFDKLNFDTGSAAIRAEDESTLAALAQILRAYPNTHAKVVGYTDTRGAADSNDTLGQRRATAVLSALGAKGVTAGHLQAVSGGESNPVASNATGEGRFENRRTELVVEAK